MTTMMTRTTFETNKVPLHRKEFGDHRIIVDQLKSHLKNLRETPQVRIREANTDQKLPEEDPLWNSKFVIRQLLNHASQILLIVSPRKEFRIISIKQASAVTYAGSFRCVHPDAQS